MDQVAKYARRLEAMSSDRLLNQAFLADCRLPAHLSWYRRLSAQLQPDFVSTPTNEDPSLQTFSVRAARAAYEQQLQIDDSSKTWVYRELKIGYQCEAYIQRCNNRRLRRIIAQFRTGSHWFSIETGCYK